MCGLRGWACLAALFAFAALQSCEIINPKEDLPAYITFRSPRVVLDDNTGFSSQAGVRNIWLYHGGFHQGTYEMDPRADTLPRTIPVLELSRTDFFIEGGVFESGQSIFQIPYPFWERIQFNWSAIAGDTLIVDPVFKYIDASLYDAKFNEQFEGGSVDLVPFGSTVTQTDSTFVQVQGSDVFRGTGSGYVHFGNGDRWFEAINSTSFRALRSQNIFLEITYKNSVALTVGLIYQNTSGIMSNPVITLNPSGTWNTVYVHLIREVREIINFGGESTNFWIWLKADGEGQEGYIYLDDMRLINEK